MLLHSAHPRETAASESTSRRPRSRDLQVRQPTSAEYVFITGLSGDRNGPPVLLWHGFLSTGYAWPKVMTVLADAGLAVLVPDMRGFGDSEKPAGTGGYDARALAQEFRALARRIGFGGGQPITLVKNRLAMVPMTRDRSTPAGVPTSFGPSLK